MTNRRWIVITFLYHVLYDTILLVEPINAQRGWIQTTNSKPLNKHFPSKTTDIIFALFITLILRLQSLGLWLHTFYRKHKHRNVGIIWSLSCELDIKIDYYCTSLETNEVVSRRSGMTDPELRTIKHTINSITSFFELCNTFSLGISNVCHYNFFLHNVEFTRL